MGQEQTNETGEMFTPKFKATTPTGAGVWNPNSSSTGDLQDEVAAEQSSTTTATATAANTASTAPTPPPPPPPSRPIWTPQPSPTTARKEFRPVRFESPTLPRRYTAQQSVDAPAVPPPWSTEYTNVHSSNLPTSARSNNSYTNLSTPTSVGSCSTNCFEFFNDYTPTALPNSSVSEKIKNIERSVSTSELSARPRRQLEQIRPFYRPNEVIRPQYKTTGYQSEPEPNYDSDYSTLKYRTNNRRRLQSASSTQSCQDDSRYYGTMPNAIKSTQYSYKNQPGRIEEYITGHSSVSDKQRKEQLDPAKLSPHYTEGNLSRALAKDSGYTSDTNLVFRKKVAPQASALSPIEQKQVYRSVQAGGEPPLFGFRKPAPEKPKESPNRYYESDVNIHFKTPVRSEFKGYIPEDELAIRQAEQMQKLYQEERRRKYLQELQDMNARRHTDNFTTIQKSPIPLNRYDDFPTDVTLKSIGNSKIVARALYNFQGQSSKELSFKKGDVIYIRKQVDKNWYEGEHNAMIGLLPKTYVEIVSTEGARHQQTRKPSEGQARARYNFQAQSGVELSLNKGELVTLTRRVDNNWFEGKIANRKGIFPVNYVEVLIDIGADDNAKKTVITEHSTTNLRPTLDAMRTNINNEFNLITQNGHQPPNGILKDTRHLQKTDVLHVDTHTEPLAYRALYKYRPQNSDELELMEGDVVHVLEKCDDGWFVGTSQRTGCFGTFPGNYVERI